MLTSRILSPSVSIGIISTSAPPCCSKLATCSACHSANLLALVPILIFIIDKSLIYNRAATAAECSHNMAKLPLPFLLSLIPFRSEERRVGKECSSPWWPCHGERKQTTDI